MHATLRVSSSPHAFPSVARLAGPKSPGPRPECPRCIGKVYYSTNCSACCTARSIRRLSMTLYAIQTHAVRRTSERERTLGIDSALPMRFPWGRLWRSCPGPIWPDLAERPMLAVVAGLTSHHTRRAKPGRVKEHEGQQPHAREREAKQHHRRDGHFAERDLAEIESCSP
jgi:hypothetical protein